MVDLDIVWNSSCRICNIRLCRVADKSVLQCPLCSRLHPVITLGLRREVFRSSSALSKTKSLPSLAKIAHDNTSRLPRLRREVVVRHLISRKISYSELSQTAIFSLLFVGYVVALFRVAL